MTRVKGVLNRLISDKLVIRLGVPRERDQRITTIIRNYFLEHRLQFHLRKSDPSDAKQRRSRAQDKFGALWDGFFLIFNGDLCNKDIIEHWTADTQLDRVKVVRAMVQALLVLVFSRGLSKPEGGNGPSLDPWWIGFQNR